MCVSDAYPALSRCVTRMQEQENIHASQVVMQMVGGTEF